MLTDFRRAVDELDMIRMAIIFPMSTSIVSRSTITSVSALLLIAIVLSASATLANVRTKFILAYYEKEKPSRLELGGVLIKSSMN